MMIRPRKAFYILVFFAPIQAGACGKSGGDKNQKPAAVNPYPNWDLKSDVAAADLKAKDL